MIKRLPKVIRRVKFDLVAKPKCRARSELMLDNFLEMQEAWRDVPFLVVDGWLN